MNQPFIINSAIELAEIKDALYQKLTQARSMSACLIEADVELDPITRNGMLLAIDSSLEEIDKLIEYFLKLK